jgi:hypothetical protein
LIAYSERNVGCPRLLRRLAPAIAVFALLGVSGVFEAASRQEGVANGYLIDASKAGGQQALMQAAGEFRVVAANLIWAKTVDKYHHLYIMHGGSWAKNVSLLPLLQTIIDLDPHFTQAYELMGGSILPHTGHLAEGRHVLLQGIKNNPNDWELDRELAMLYAWTEKRPADALPYAEAGLANAHDSFSHHLMTLLCNTLKRQIADRRTG